MSQDTAATPRARTAISWGVLDQIVSSAATFLFIVVAASSLTAPELGAIAFVFEFYLLSVFVARGITGDALTSRFAGTDPAVLRQAIRVATTVALLVGVGIGVLVATGGAFASGPLQGTLLVAAIALPGLTLQDFVRSALIVQGKVRSTFLNDLFWATVQLPAMGVAIWIDATAVSVLAAWAATGCVAAGIGLVQLRCGLAHPRRARGWLRETRDIWPFYLADNMLYQVGAMTLMAVVSATAGLAAMAGFRIAMTVYAPMSLIGRGVITVCVALLAPRRTDPDGIRRSATLISAILTPLPLAWGLLLLLVPTEAGAKVFGESWHEAEPLVFLAAFVCASGLFTTGVVIGLRALSAGRHTFTGRVIVTVGAAAAALVGGVLGQEYGVFLALAWFFPVQALVWWLLLRHATGRARARLARSDPSQAVAST